MVIPLAKRLARSVARASYPWTLANAALAKRGFLLKPLIFHVAGRGWVLGEIRDALGRRLKRRYAIVPISRRGIRRFGIRNSIIHFSTGAGYSEDRRYLEIHPSNRQVLTWTHGQRSNLLPVFQRRLDAIGEASLYTDKIIVASSLAADILISEGVDGGKLAYIPLGIDTRLFTPPTPEDRNAMRRKLGVPDGALCVGSFQKDGEGWGEGMTPKHVKGPDVFLRVIDRLRKDFELYVLLTGPSRGYVKSGLETMGVPYRHTWLEDYEDVAKHYWALDLYLIASRDEGGPMAVLESMASGVPLVSTRVGMAIDLISHGESGFLSEVEDANALATNASKLIASPELRCNFSRNGLDVAKGHDWGAIAERYHQEVYRPLLVEDGYSFAD